MSIVSLFLFHYSPFKKPVIQDSSKHTYGNYDLYTYCVVKSIDFYTFYDEKWHMQKARLTNYYSITASQGLINILIITASHNQAHNLTRNIDLFFNIVRVAILIN